MGFGGTEILFLIWGLVVAAVCVAALILAATIFYLAKIMGIGPNYDNVPLAAQAGSPIAPQRNIFTFLAIWFVSTAGIVTCIHLAEVALLDEPPTIDFFWDMPALMLTSFLALWCGLPAVAFYPVQFTASAICWGTIGAFMGAIYESGRIMLTPRDHHPGVST